MGANDPEEEGFEPVQARNNAEQGPVFDDLGRDAWSIRPRSGNEFGIYQYDLTEQEVEDALAYGWELSVTLRLLTPDDLASAVSFFTAAQHFRLDFRTDENGIPRVTDSRLNGGVYPIEESDGGYHRYTLTYDPLPDRVTLWIDGVEREPDFGFRTSTASSHLLFGTREAESEAYWHEVSLTIIPEPATGGFLAGAMALLLVAGARWRRRKSTRLSGLS